jgi:hypothetical protein
MPAELSKGSTSAHYSQCNVVGTTWCGRLVLLKGSHATADS